MDRDPGASTQHVAEQTPIAASHGRGTDAADEIRAEIESLREELERARVLAAAELVELDDARALQRAGIYEYHHPLENAEAYKDRLEELRGRIRAMVRGGGAVVASDRFAFDNSLAKGRKMVADLSTLMLRAYNAEADNAVRSLRAGNLQTATQRLAASAAAIEKLGAMMQMRIDPAYQALRVEELELTADHLIMIQEEREKAREERERLREERKAEEEIARERERLEKERSHYINALASLQAQGKDDAGGDIARHLADLDAAIAQNDYRAANIRAGYVYVISNIGAFGEKVVKIGMTRRLDPVDRVRELGDASVPFPFDVHAIYFSDDAVRLEGELHAAFSAYRVNHVNARREFFFASPEQVRAVLTEKVGQMLEFVEGAEATQFHQSRHYWPAEVAPGAWAARGSRGHEPALGTREAVDITDSVVQDGFLGDDG